MSDQNLESVISHLTTVNQACSERGSNIRKRSIHVTFFSSLACYSFFKTYRQRINNVDKFQFTNLWIKD